MSQIFHMRNHTKQLLLVHLRFNFNWVYYIFLFATCESPQKGIHPGWEMLKPWVKAARSPWMLPPLSWENKGAFSQTLTVWTFFPWFTFHCLLKSSIYTWSGLIVRVSIYCTVPPWMLPYLVALGGVGWSEPLSSHRSPSSRCRHDCRPRTPLPLGSGAALTEL